MQEEAGLHPDAGDKEEGRRHHRQQGFLQGLGAQQLQGVHGRDVALDLGRFKSLRDSTLALKQCDSGSTWCARVEIIGLQPDCCAGKQDWDLLLNHILAERPGISITPLPITSN